MEGPNLAFQYCSFPVFSVNEMLRDNVTDSRHLGDTDVFSEAEWIISGVLVIASFHSQRLRFAAARQQTFRVKSHRD